MQPNVGGVDHDGEQQVKADGAPIPAGRGSAGDSSAAIGQVLPRLAAAEFEPHDADQDGESVEPCAPRLHLNHELRQKILSALWA
jgi:hypothetical protein